MPPDAPGLRVGAVVGGSSGFEVNARRLGGLQLRLAIIYRECRQRADQLQGAEFIVAPTIVADLHRDFAGFVKATQLAVRLAQARQTVGQPLAQFDRPKIAAQCLLKMAQAQMREAQVGPRSVSIRPQFERTLAKRDRLLKQLQLEMRDGQRVLRARRLVTVDTLQFARLTDRPLRVLLAFADDCQQAKVACRQVFFGFAQQLVGARAIAFAQRMKARDKEVRHGLRLGQTGHVDETATAFARRRVGVSLGQFAHVVAVGNLGDDGEVLLCLFELAEVE